MNMENEKKSSLSRRSFIGRTAAALTAFTIVPRFVLGKGYLAPSDKVTLGVIGCGRQSKGLMSNFLKIDMAQVVACSDIDSQKLAIFQQFIGEKYAEKAGKGAYEGVGTYANYSELLDRKDIDAVVIITPDHWHAIMAIEAMQKGKDVYCEKPLAHTVKEGRAMVNATKKYGKILQTGSMQRSWEKFRHACELVRNGYIGDLKEVKVNVGDPGIACDLADQPIPSYLNWDAWNGPAPARGYNEVLSPPSTFEGWPMWRAYREYGGGILSDWGAHMFDIAQWGMGMDASGPVSFVPPTDPAAKRGLEMTYANGVIMRHEDFGRGWAVRFIGSKGSIDVSRGFLDSNPANIVEAKISDGQTRLYKSDNHYQDWLDCLKTRKQPICDPETGHRSASVCNLANIAYQLRRPLTWDPVKEKFAKDKEANTLLGKDHRKPYTLPKV